MLLTDWQIANLCTGERPMIEPFIDHTVRSSSFPIISYGLSSVGYDIRCTKVFTFPTATHVIDPKNLNNGQWWNEQDEAIILKPGKWCLVHSVETFTMPFNVTGIGYAKSTYLRCGLIVPISPLEPGWEGQLTIQVQNPTSNPIRIYAEEGIAQIVFYSHKTPTADYGIRGNPKYQGQTGTKPADV